jgi:hypothetical protein
MTRINNNQRQVNELPENTAINSPRSASRQDKAGSFLNEVLPMALSMGLKLGTTEGLGEGLGGTRGTHSAKETTKIKSQKLPTNSSIASGAGLAGSSAGFASLAGAMNIAGGILGAAEIATNWGRSTPAAGAASGTAVGAAIGTMFAPGIGTAIGAAIGAIGGGLLGSIKTGKHRDQKIRDEVRSFLQGAQVLDSNHSIGLADGSRFNIGYDGGPKKELGGRRPFETDMSNPLTKYATSWLNPVVAFISQGNQKVQSDFVGYFSNAAVSNAKSLNDVRDNVNAIIKQFGLDDKKIVQGIVEAARSGAIDSELAKAWLNGVKERSSTDFTGEDSAATRGTNRARRNRAQEVDDEELSVDESISSIDETGVDESEDEELGLVSV